MPNILIPGIEKIIDDIHQEAKDDLLRKDQIVPTPPLLKDASYLAVFNEYSKIRKLVLTAYWTKIKEIAESGG